MKGSLRCQVLRSRATFLTKGSQIPPAASAGLRQISECVGAKVGGGGGTQSSHPAFH